MVYKVEKEIGGRTLTIETGRLAKQADGAVWVRYADTVVLTSAVSGRVDESRDFFPLLMDYREKAQAAGKIPGGRYYKREGRPSAKEILTMRMMDRPIRPLFPKGYRNEVQVNSIVLSADRENDPDVVAMVGASASLCVSDIPFQGPTGAVRIGRVEGQFIVNPTHTQLETSELDLIVAGTAEAVTMVEASANEMAEEDMLRAIALAHSIIKEIVAMQLELRDLCGKPKQAFEPIRNEPLERELEARLSGPLAERVQISGKLASQAAVRELEDSVVEELCAGDEPQYPKNEVKAALEHVKKKVVRGMILSGTRCDGRSTTEIRPISCEVGVLPRTHGSGLFTRGETQALVVATLGTSMDEELVDGLRDEYARKFMVHYNFPAFSVGEVKPERGPGRREIGHGVLAERALSAVLPDPEEFPYTIRIVSDILESNGSSSMATVCGGTLSMMDAGVPIRHPVAGIAMGLISEGDQVRILSDIAGEEDAMGDMDFKVAGTQEGIAALQMDIKTTGVTEATMTQALEQAREGRMHILRQMLSVLDRPRPEISCYAPKLFQIKIDPEKIGAVIGPGGKVIRKIEADSGARVEIENDGTVTVSSPSGESAEVARTMIEALTEEATVGKTYTGTVTATKDFGAFVEILPGQEGLVHISELADGYVERVEDVVKAGDIVEVKLIAVDEKGRIKLSRRALLSGSSKDEHD